MRNAIISLNDDNDDRPEHNKRNDRKTIAERELLPASPIRYLALDRTAGGLLQGLSQLRRYFAQKVTHGGRLLSKFRKSSRAVM
jgi:hypothetical protein